VKSPWSSVRLGWPDFVATWTVGPPDPVPTPRGDVPTPPWTPAAAATAADVATTAAENGAYHGGGAAHYHERALLLPREINPASPAEARLATTLGHRLALLPVLPIVSGPDGATTASAVLTGRHALPGARREAAARLAHLARTYDPTVWGSPTGPPGAVSDGDLILAAVVVLPELLAALTLWVTTPVARSGRHCAVFAAIYTVGIASLGSIWALAVKERSRAEWHRRSASSALTAVLPAGIDGAADRTGAGLAGTVVVLETTLLLGAVGAHRLRLVWGLGVGLTAAYVLLTTPLLIAGATRYWRWVGGIKGVRGHKEHRGQPGQRGGGGGGGAGG